MNKLKLLILFFAALLSVWSCKKPNQFKIKGKITHANGQMIYLDELHVSGDNVTIDSVKIDKKGEFSLSGNTSIPSFYLIKLSQNKFIKILADSSEVINIYADEVNFSTKYRIEGSPGSVLVQELDNRLNITNKRIDSLAALNILYKGLDEYPQIKNELDKEGEKIVNEQIKYSTEFVKNNPFSMASVLALYQRFNDNNYVIRDLQSLKVAASALNSIYPESEHVKVLYANTMEMVKNESAAKLKQLIEEKGQNSPEIILPDISGNEISLSSLRGKYVLLQFWSVNDSGSRIFNEVLVELYKKFKNKGFEIYQVSIDSDKDDWINAINEDRLSWINVGDMNGSAKATNSYNIQNIPYNYLLDKEGSIVGKNLKGSDINTALSKYLR